MHFLLKEVISLIFCFQTQWKFFFYYNKLLSLEKLHTFCQDYNYFDHYYSCEDYWWQKVTVVTKGNHWISKMFYSENYKNKISVWKFETKLNSIKMP